MNPLATAKTEPALDAAGGAAHGTAIVGARVIPIVSAELAVGTVLMRHGRIEAVGDRLTVPSDYEVVDAAGLWLLPGLVESHAHVGLHEESNGIPGDDTNESSAPNTAGIRALDGINIDDPGFLDALLGGITTVIVKPGSANPFAGQSVALKTAGSPLIDERVVSDSVSIKSGLGENPKLVHGAAGRSPITRMGTAHVIRQALRDVQRTTNLEQPQPDLHSEALARLLTGELIWDVHAHRHDDIATAMRLAREFELRLVINHGVEAYKLTETIAERGLPVIIGPVFTARSKVELAGLRTTTAAILDAAGITVAITTDHPEVPIHLLAAQAAFAMREGLPREAALRALTESPASMFGLANRVGALAVGRDADVVLWSGDPLDAQSRVERVLIEGRPVYSRGSKTEECAT